MRRPYSAEDAKKWYEDYQDLNIPVNHIVRKHKVKHCTMIRVLRKFGFPLRPSGFRAGNLRGRPNEGPEALRRRKYLWLYKFTYKRRAARKELEFTLTEDDFVYLVTGSCYYCGKSYSEDTRIVNKYKVFMLTVDRVDSNKGYTKENCVSCCKQCNTIKMDMTLEDFLSKIKQIYGRHCA